MREQRDKRTGAAAGLLAVLFALLLTAGCGAEPDGMEALKVTVRKVGKADAIVLQTGDRAMVIDAGEEEDGQELTDFLTRQKISRVETLIITHFDQDHVGGADTLVDALEVGQVLLPDYEGEGAEYEDFLDALDRKKLLPRRLNAPEEFAFGEASVLAEPPASYEAKSKGEADNNFSLITTVTHGENRLVFLGDAQKRRCREWLDGGTAGPCGFIKMPHHGVYQSELERLIETVRPEYAAICDSRKHPADSRTLELLKQHDVGTFQTKNGDVTVLSDGRGLEVHQELDQ